LPRNRIRTRRSPRCVPLRAQPLGRGLSGGEIAQEWKCASWLAGAPEGKDVSASVVARATRPNRATAKRAAGKMASRQIAGKRSTVNGGRSHRTLSPFGGFA